MWSCRGKGCLLDSDEHGVWAAMVEFSACVQGMRILSLQAAARAICRALVDDRTISCKAPMLFHAVCIDGRLGNQLDIVGGFHATARDPPCLAAPRQPMPAMFVAGPSWGSPPDSGTALETLIELCLAFE